MSEGVIWALWFIGGSIAGFVFTLVGITKLFDLLRTRENNE